MKLVIATPLYPPDIGGPATYVKALEEGLPAHGIEVTVVKFSDVRHWPKLVRHYMYYRRIYAAAKHADIILALDPVSVGWPAMKAARCLGKPLVVKIVGDYAWEQGRQRFGVTQDLDDFVQTPQPSFFVRKLQEVEARVASAATRIIVPSQYLKGIVVAWGIPPEKIEVIYNSVALPTTLKTIERPKGFLIVSSGRRVPWKGFEGIERVVRGQSDWHFFLAEGLPRSEALAWVRSADVFVLNSTYEGFSHALLEAMMLGTPVIATSVGGNPELIQDKETGLLVASGDDEALLTSLRQVEQDRAGAHKRAIAAQERMREFSVETMLLRTSDVLKSSKKLDIGYPNL